ncbi:MAG: MarR family transcriptional regulator [Saprospiraceae bacterium]|jgi:DNA-binding MarR family transcriptional regulator|nr:MarR family transcriptional regulator [Saprospiraceae bacterium]
MINKFIRIDFPENFLMPWLGKTSKMLRMFLKINFQEHGFDLTHEQFILIAHLYHRDGINQKDLAFITERNKGSLARLVNTTEKKNLVVRVPSLEDKRVNIIYLTKQGRCVFEKLKPVLDDCEAQVKKGLTQKEVKAMISILEKIQNNISD